MAGAANGSGGGGKEGFEVPRVEVRFTKLFIDGNFVEAVSGTHTPISSSSSPPAWLHPSIRPRRRSTLAVSSSLSNVFAPPARETVTDTRHDVM
jgi:hypothetical protein